jgi:anti-anti-sigma factor
MLKPSLETRNVDGVLVSEFWDCLRLDPAPVQELRNRYDTHRRTGGRPDVVVDLSGVAFAGSAALGNFVALHRLARHDGGRIVFCNVDPTVSEVLRASKLESLFEFAVDRADALRVLKGPPAPPAFGPKPGAAAPAAGEKPLTPGRGGGGGPLKRRNVDPGAT